MKENFDLLSEEELERELESAREWNRFGEILSAAHDSVYEKPQKSPEIRQTNSICAQFLRKKMVWRTLSATLLLLLGLGIAEHFLSRGAAPSGNAEVAEAEGEFEDDFDWDAGDSDLAMMDQLVDQVAFGDASVDFEIAILEDSLGEWSESEDENWF